MSLPSTQIPAIGDVRVRVVLAADGDEAVVGRR